VDCSKGCTALEGSTVAFETSAGPVPDVAGKTVDAATAALSAVNLNATTTQAYDDEVAEGRVIHIADKDGGAPFRPGDTVTLVVSKGPQPIPVPDVTGKTVAQAMDQLKQAGFEPGTALPEIVWGIFTVSSTSPAAGTSQLPGTKITVRSTG
jgi:serine/threonine-protein kinase